MFLLKTKHLTFSLSEALSADCCFFQSQTAPGGWANNWGAQGAQDYAYFESGFATGTRQLPSRQQDGSVRQRSKRHRKIRGPTKDHKIQIYFNITGTTTFCVFKETVRDNFEFDCKICKQKQA